MNQALTRNKRGYRGSAFARHQGKRSPPQAPGRGQRSRRTIDKAAAESSEGPAASNGHLPIAASEVEHTLVQFVHERCVVGHGGSCAAKDLYIAYIRWCDEIRHSPMSQRNFGVSLSILGFERRRRDRSRH